MRVLIVDDSATVRAVLRRLLDDSPGIEIVGEAADGVDAVKQTLALAPDAVVMDLDLPRLDGLAATEQIMSRCPTPVVVVTSKVRREEMAAAFEALKRGAVSVFAKPTVPDQWADLAHVLPETLRQVGPRQRAGATVPASCGYEAGRALRCLLLGASTGGPAAVRALLAQLMPGLTTGVAVVQHISPGFELGLADWLERELGADVEIARDGEVLQPGRIRIAPAGSHLRINCAGVLRLDPDTPAMAGHRPAIDVLFESALALPPEEVAAVLLTGMGRDGARGLLALRSRGALTLTQDEASCAVFGMPRVAREIGATDTFLPPSELGRLLSRSMTPP